MPNWCSNVVVVQGDPDEVEALVNAVDNGVTPFSLNQLVKLPDALKDTSAPERDESVAQSNISTYGAKDWYDWCNKNWGTKWDVSAQIVWDETSPMLPGLRTIKYQFESAWAPPLKVFDVLAARFPNTNIYVCWDEPGCDFAGYRMYRDGELIKHHESESYEGRDIFYRPTEEVFSYFPEEKEVDALKKQEEERRQAEQQVQTALQNLQTMINNL